MPNWCYCSITVSGDEKQVAAFFAKHIVDGRFDFNTIIPEPKTKDECLEAFYVNADSHIQTDADRPWFDWYRWRCVNWGTKWNAHDTQYDEANGTIDFDTAWSDPAPVIEALFNMYKDLKFDYKFIEEQGPVYLGHIIVDKGNTVLCNVPDAFSREAYELMFEMWDNRDCYVFDRSSGSYEYIDDELQDEYDEFCRIYPEYHDAGMTPPCFEEWYNNDRNGQASSN